MCLLFQWWIQRWKKHCPHWGDPLPKLILTLDKLPKLHFTHYSVRIAPARAKVEEIRNYLYDLSFFCTLLFYGTKGFTSRSYCLYFPVFGVVAQRNIKLTNIIPLKIILPQAMDAWSSMAGRRCVHHVPHVNKEHPQDLTDRHQKCLFPIKNLYMFCPVNRWNIKRSSTALDLYLYDMIHK